MIVPRDEVSDWICRLLSVVTIALLLTGGTAVRAWGQRGAGQVIILAKDDTRILGQADSAGQSVADLPKGTRVLVDSGAAIQDGYVLVAYPKRGWVAMAHLTSVASGGWMQHGSLHAITELPNTEWGPVVGYRPFDGDGNWMMEQDLKYKVGKSGLTIVVPAGFVTDFASIPSILQGFLPPSGPYRDPAVIHDFLYWDQRCSKSQADNLLFIALSETRTDRDLAKAITDVVSLAGTPAWDGNARDRRSRLPRVIPPDRRQLPRETWEVYRKRLFDQGVHAPPADGAAPPGYCALGNSRKLP